MKKSSALILTILLVLIAMASATFLFTSQSGEAQMAIKFDKKIWTDDKSIYDTPNIRLQMIDDVISNQLAVGKSRDEVIEILGKPTDTPYFKDYDLVYWLGDEKSLINVDSAWLVIKLDDQGNVTSFEKVTD